MVLLLDLIARFNNCHCVLCNSYAQLYLSTLSNSDFTEAFSPRTSSASILPVIGPKVQPNMAWPVPTCRFESDAKDFGMVPDMSL